MRKLDGTTTLNMDDIVRNKNLREAQLHDSLEASAIINSRLKLNHVLEQAIIHATKLTNSVATIISNLAAVSVSNAKSYDNLHRTNYALKSQLFSSDMVIGKNKKMNRILQSINKLKDAKSNVLILGESGTGKGIIARAIH